MHQLQLNKSVKKKKRTLSYGKKKKKKEQGGKGWTNIGADKKRFKGVRDQ